MDQDPARPSLLYHYTSAAGLNGILTSGSIYATDVEFLNDAQELWYGRPELCDALTNELHASPGTVIGDLDGPAGRIGRIAVALQYLTGDSAERRAAMLPVFVACFCADGDLLSQWRGYASPGGYAIGFDTAALAQIVDTEPRYAGLLQVEYGPTAVESMVKHVIDSFEPKRPISRTGSTISLEGWSHTNEHVLARLAAVKHPAFREEAEWRIITRADPAEPQINFRDGALGLIPYRMITIATAIREIIVGPGADQPTRELGVRRLVHFTGQADRVAIRASAASYRG